MKVLNLFILILFLGACQTNQPLKNKGIKIKEIKKAKNLNYVGTFKRPILCDGPKGEGFYLSRLRKMDGSDIS